MTALDPTTSMRPRGQLLKALLGTIVGIALAFSVGAGFPFWISAAAIGLLLTIGFAHYLSWTISLVMAISALLVILLVVMRLSPFAGKDLVVASQVGLVIAVLLAASLIVGSRRVLRRPSLGSWALSCSVVVGPFVGAVASIITYVRPHSGVYSWAMAGDSISGMMFSRFIVADGGVNSSIHPQSAPFPFGLIAMQIGPARGGMSAEDLLRRDILGQSALWALFFILVSLLMSCAVALASEPAKGPVRLVAVVAAGLLPYSWFVLGFSTEFGYFNVIVCTLLMVSSWLLWYRLRENPGLAILGLLGIGVTTLATWAPLVVIPATFGILALFQCRRQILVQLQRPFARLLALSAALLGVAYVALVTVPDVLNDSSRLATDGAIPFSMPSTPLVVGGIAALFAIVAYLVTRETPMAAGLTALIGASVPVLLFLLYQRRNSPTLWGYYPEKFVWVISIALIPVLLAISVSVVSQLGSGWLKKTSAAVGLGILILGLMAQLPPDKPGLSAITPLHAIAVGNQQPVSRSVANDVFDLTSTPGAIVWEYRGHVPDSQINSWLVQMRVSRADAIERNLVYWAPTQSSLCDYAKEVSSPVTVFTSSRTLATSPEAECPSAPLTFVYRKPSP